MSEKKSFPLRLPQDLYEKVKRLADAELRSVNSQIEVMLRGELSRRGVSPPGDPPPEG